MVTLKPKMVGLGSKTLYERPSLGIDRHANKGLSKISVVYVAIKMGVDPIDKPEYFAIFNLHLRLKVPRTLADSKNGESIFDIPVKTLLFNTAARRKAKKGITFAG